MAADAAVPVFVADDHALLRRGLVDVVRQSGLYTVVGEAGEGTAALAGIRQHRPAIAILDVEMPGLSGLEVAATVREEGIATSIVLLTMHDEPEILDRAMAVGVKGYVLKDGALSDIINCLNLVREGRMYVSAALSGALVQRRSRREDAQDAGGRILDRLTAAERKVIRLVAKNLTSAQIAEQLGISPKTVENHRARIAARLELRGPQALLRFALEHRTALD